MLEAVDKPLVGRVHDVHQLVDDRRLLPLVALVSEQPAYCPSHVASEDVGSVRRINRGESRLEVADEREGAFQTRGSKRLVHAFGQRVGHAVELRTLVILTSEVGRIEMLAPRPYARRLEPCSLFLVAAGAQHATTGATWRLWRVCR